MKWILSILSLFLFAFTMPVMKAGTSRHLHLYADTLPYLGPRAMFYALLGSDCSVSDPDACSYIARLKLKNKVLTYAEQTAVNDWYVGMKADGNYAIVTDAILPVWGTDSASLVSMKGVITWTAHGSPAFSTTGVDPDGSTSCIKTNWIPSAHSEYLNSFHAMYYCSESVTSGVKEMVGSETSVGGNKISGVPRNNSNQVRIMINATAYGGAASNTSTVGNFFFVRTTSNASAAYKGSAAAGTSTTVSTGLPSNPLVFAGTWSGTATNPSPSFDGQARALQFGLGANSTQVSAMNSRWETLLDALGLGVQ